MIKKQFKLFAYLLISVTLTLGLSLSLQSLLAAWTAPTALPPNDNVTAPIYSDPGAGNDQTVSNGDLEITGGDLLVQGAHTLTANNLTVDLPDETFWINATENRVGIGTTDPDPLFKLDVEGDIQANNFCNTTGTCLNSITGLPSGNSGDTLRRNATGWLANSLLFNNGTRIGIGTTNPGSTLEVKGGSVQFGNEVSGDIFYSDGYDTYIKATTSINFQSPNRTTRLTVLSNGNVGIGDSNPANKLVINNANGVRAEFKSTQNWSDLWFESGMAVGIIGASANPERMYINTNSNDPLILGAQGRDTLFIVPQAALYSNVGIGNSTPQAKLDVTGTLKVSTLGAGETRCLQADADGDVYFATGPCSTGGSTQWANETNGISYINGNVGIGTAPDANKRLHVWGNGRDISFGNSASGDIFYSDGNDTFLKGSASVNLQRPDGATILRVDNVGTFVTGDMNVDSNTFYVQAMDNEVGINTNNPNGALEIFPPSALQSTRLNITNVNAGDHDLAIGFRLAAGVNTFSVGVDDSDDDKLKITRGSLLGIDDVVRFDTTGGMEVVDRFYTTANRGVLNISPADGVGGHEGGQINIDGISGTTNFAIDNYYDIFSGTPHNILRYLYNNGSNIGLILWDNGQMDVNNTAMVVPQTGDRFTIYNGNLRIQSTGGTGILINETQPSVNLDNKLWKLYADSAQVIGTTQLLGTANPDSGVGGQIWLRVKRNNANISSVNFENGDVGIGNSTPQAKLDVTGTLKVSTLGAGETRCLQADADGDVYFATGPCSMGGSTQWANETNGISYINGNVGIGTAPDANKRLHVWGNGRAIQFGNAASGDIFYSDGTNTYLKGGTVEFQSQADATRLYVNTNTGNVGIGTINPAAKLEIETTVFGNNLLLDSSGTGISTLAFATDGTAGGDIGLARSAGHFFLNAGIGDMTLRSYSNKILLGQGVGNATMVINGSSVGIGTNNPNSRLEIDMLNLTTTQGLYISRDAAASHYAYLNIENELGAAGPIFKVHESGNVGIGTNVPSAMFNGLGESITGPNLSVEGANAGASITIGSRNDQKGQIHLENTRLVISTAGNDWGPNNNIIFATEETSNSYSPTERLRITAAGNVGIGDNTPVDLFTVGNGDLFRVDTSGNLIRINNVAYSWPAAQATAAGQVLTNNGAGTLTWAAAGGLPSGANTNTLRHNGTAWIANSVLQVSSSQVGINIAPDRPLRVSGSAPGSHTALFGNGSIGAVGIGAGNDQYGSLGTAGEDLYINPSNGNVGIGLSWGTAPTAQLDVDGNIRARTLTNCNTIDTDGSGNFSCGTDAGGTPPTIEQRCQTMTVGSVTGPAIQIRNCYGTTCSAWVTIYVSDPDGNDCSQGGGVLFNYGH